METPDIQRWVRAARRERSVYDPGRSRTAPPDGAGNKTYKPEGEVAENAVREVGVTRSTREPQQNKSCGTASNQWGGGVATQKAPLRGKGSRWRWQKRTEEGGQVGMSGLMVAAAMTETLFAESSHGAGKTPKQLPATPAEQARQ